MAPLSANDRKGLVSGVGLGTGDAHGTLGYEATIKEQARSVKFTITGRLPSLNEYIHAMNRHYLIGHSFKKKQMRLIGMYIIAGRVPVFDKPVVFTIRYFERDNRRDRDNVQSAAKYILDTMKRMQRIKDDSQKWVRDVFSEVLIDKTNPRIEVTITEVL